MLLFPAMTVQDRLLELKGVLILCYTLYFTGITVYTFVRLRRAKLQNFVMAKTLLQQAYVDALTEIPNRRASHAQRGQPGAARHRGAKTTIWRWWTSTTSRRSMTATATTLATKCSSTWPRGSSW
ncbi:hypothetical protein ACU4GD_10370 [Cupriavidus basilensis]